MRYFSSLLLYLAAGICGLSAGCRTPTTASSSDAQRLASWMVGAFWSTEQAAAAPDDYFDIRLVTVEIWSERTDGPWLYIEQASAKALDRPYRQRVYHLVNTDEGVRSDVYTLPDDPLKLAGAWQTPTRFDQMRPGDLTLRTGCSIYLTYEAGAFVGATRGTECSSKLREAQYATSEVRIEPARLTSWDRGWKADDSQAWGADKGPYIFILVSRD